MKFTFLFQCFIFIVGSNCFLLDDRTQPPTNNAGSVFTDHHFNILFNLLADEKQARVKLEQVVQQLQQELLATQQGVTSIYHSGQRYNDTMSLQHSALTSLDNKYNDIQMKFNSMKLKFNELQTNHSILQNYTNQINQELAALKQMKIVTDLQAMFAVLNHSQHFEKELQATNTMLNAVANDARARNQDFMALFNKADATERKLDLTVDQLDGYRNNTNALLKDIENSQIKAQSQLNTYFHTQMSMIKSNQNMTMTKLQTELYDLYLKMPDRVALTACAKSYTYQGSSTIIFPYIHTRKGISSNGVTSLENTGKFVCERSGLYLITTFIMTNQANAEVQVYKNNDIIAFIYFSMSNFYQTHAVSVIEQININDSVYIKIAESTASMYIYGDKWSCISVLQITD